MKLIKRCLTIMCLLLSFNPLAHAGVDVTGKILRVWLQDDKLWIKLDNTLVDTYCKPGWFGFNLYISTSDKNYSYYYGLIASALSKGESVRISNISVYDGTTACDILYTNYGIVVNALP